MVTGDGVPILKRRAGGRVFWRLLVYLTHLLVEVIVIQRQVTTDADRRTECADELSMNNGKEVGSG